MALIHHRRSSDRLTIRDLPRLFQPDAAVHLEANYRVRLRLEDGAIEVWTFSVYKGKCELFPGEDFDADVTLTCDDACLGLLISGAVDLPALYTQRRLAIQGNIDMALKFPRLF